MGIKITAKKQGFRRAGMAHYDTQVYPDGQFTPEQIKALKAEKNLAVEEGVADPEPKAEPDNGGQEPAAPGGGSGGEPPKGKPAK